MKATYEFLNPGTLLIEHTCEVCNESFLSPGRVRKYCSALCYLRLYRKKNYYELDAKRREKYKNKIRSQRLKEIA